MNRPSRTVVRLALAALLVAAGLRATAEDFELEVRVKVAKLDATFTQGKVSCSVYGPTQNNAPGEFRSPQNDVYGVVGSGESTFPISRGAYEGPVVVRFWANRLSQPTDARDYSCSLSLVSRNSVTRLCVIEFLANQPRALALFAPKIAESHGCTTGKVPLPPRL